MGTNHANEKSLELLSPFHKPSRNFPVQRATPGAARRAPEGGLRFQAAPSSVPGQGARRARAPRGRGGQARRRPRPAGHLPRARSTAAGSLRSPGNLRRWAAAAAGRALRGVSAARALISLYIASGDRKFRLALIIHSLSGPNFTPFFFRNLGGSGWAGGGGAQSPGVNAFTAGVERTGEVGAGGVGRGCLSLPGEKEKKKNRRSHRAAEQGGYCLRGPEVSWPLPASGRPPWQPPPAVGGGPGARWGAAVPASSALRGRCSQDRGAAGRASHTLRTPSRLTPWRRLLRAPVTRPRLSAPHCRSAQRPNLQGYRARAQGTSLTSVWF